MDKKTVATFTVLSAVALISYQTWQSMNTNKVTQTTTTKVEDKVMNSLVENKNISTYSVKKEYTVQEDNNHIITTVFLDGTTIVDIKTEYYHDSPTSAQKQEFFEKNLNKGMFIGQDITTLEISNVTGATFASNAFKEAIRDIVSQLDS